MSPELEDYAWFPKWMRCQQMEFISYMATAFALYKPLATTIDKLIQKTRNQQWTDCCSGAAGPIIYLLANGVSVNEVWLTDKFLMTPVFPKAIPATVHCQTVDVLNDPIPGEGVVSFFNAFHHFTKIERIKMLREIADSRRPLFIAEITQPTIASFLCVTAATVLGQLIFAFSVVPFRWSRILFTYFIPLNLLTITWDGWMSVFRSVSQKSFMQTAQTHSTAAYQFSFSKTGAWWKRVYVLTGEPIHHANN
jgi:hypothetical protein